MHAMHAVGVFTVAPLIRIATLIMLSLTAIAAIFMLFAIVPLPMWFVLRMWLRLSESESVLLISILMFGAIILQLPISWLADEVNRLTLM